ncbi:winged helix-turn-helix domain-containing protein [Patulibacter americanus]|uniref:winged helix-turn-helix domain-containing protein n=1 Tax=Patulibacter americanus TaxID=588672 RepID=UPI0003B3EBA8|nr:winged helix-turn-helix domain-containing protein [Patulibacter americanus]
MDDGFVGTLRGDIERRLSELEAARAEAERLQRALDALDGAPQAARASVDRVPRGTRSAQLLRVVADRPGITQREVADAVGVPGAAVYAWVRRAVLKGQIEKQERRLYPVEHAEMAA